MTSNTVKNTFHQRINYASLNPPITSGTALGLTTKGDLLGHDGTNSGRLGVGSNKQVIEADSTQTLGVKWANKSPLTGTGDLWVYQNSAGVFDTRLAVGSDYTFLQADSNAIKGVKWGGLDYRSGVATADQTIGTGAYTTVTFATQQGSSGLTPGSALAAAGTYVIYLQVCWSVSATGTRYCEITVDGTRVIGSEMIAQSGNFTTQTCSRTMALTAGQVINFRVKQTSGGNLALANSPDTISPGITYYILRLP